MDIRTDKYRLHPCMVDIDGHNLENGYDLYDADGHYLGEIVTDIDFAEWDNERINASVDKAIFD